MESRNGVNLRSSQCILVSLRLQHSIYTYDSTGQDLGVAAVLPNL
jgi:hypothetical protein